ncbi:COG3650 family protein [Marivita sp. S0852]|uniref:COG3650 family protein n=1 Tax=Marivita sp. S0852 TaxID=3373893 RepID=UPI00398205C5
MGMKCAVPLLFCATAALAEPSYTRVIGVAMDDTLNIRSAPSASSDDIGDLAPDARGIEVTGLDGTGDWARIGVGEINGWVAARFLEPDQMQTFAKSAVPHGVFCQGTEPFWGLGLYETDAVYSNPDDGDIALTLDSVTIAQGRLGSPALFTLSSAANDAIEATIIGATCSDGMSDRTYGWTVTLQHRAPGSQRFLTGCCSLPRD